MRFSEDEIVLLVEIKNHDGFHWSHFEHFNGWPTERVERAYKALRRKGLAFRARTKDVYCFSDWEDTELSGAFTWAISEGEKLIAHRASATAA